MYVEVWDLGWDRVPLTRLCIELCWAVPVRELFFESNWPKSKAILPLQFNHWQDKVARMKLSRSISLLVENDESKCQRVKLLPGLCQESFFFFPSRKKKNCPCRLGLLFTNNTLVPPGLPNSLFNSCFFCPWVNYWIKRFNRGVILILLLRFPLIFMVELFQTLYLFLYFSFWCYSPPSKADQRAYPTNYYYPSPYCSSWWHSPHWVPTLCSTF